MTKGFLKRFLRRAAVLTATAGMLLVLGAFQDEWILVHAGTAACGVGDDGIDVVGEGIEIVAGEQLRLRLIATPGSLETAQLDLFLPPLPAPAELAVTVRPDIDTGPPTDGHDAPAGSGQSDEDI